MLIQRVFPIVVAIDPGEHIGLAKRQADGSIALSLILFSKAHPNGLDELVKYLAYCQPKAVIIENFATSANLTVPALHTIRALGVAQGCALTLRSKVIIQSPQARYPYLEEARITYPGHIVHEIDAYAHLLSYIRKEVEATQWT